VSAAEFLSRMLPGSRVERLPVDLDGVTLKGRRGRPKKHRDGTGRVQHHRAKKQAEINRLSAILRGSEGTTTTEDFLRYQRLVQQPSLVTILLSRKG
jgi:hypothetical protein